MRDGVPGVAAEAGVGLVRGLPEVRDLELEEARQQEVPGLHVPVDPALPVDVRQPREELRGVERGGGLREAALALQDLQQVLGAELEHQEAVPTAR